LHQENEPRRGNSRPGPGRRLNERDRYP
jgi:hypothetical protein